jgi:hypothetical protein
MNFELFKEATRLREDINVLGNLTILLNESDPESIKVTGNVSIEDPSRDRHVPRELVLTSSIIQDLLFAIANIRTKRTTKFDRLGEVR